jgi:16S rRNA G966 N2-methylase RsmD
MNDQQIENNNAVVRQKMHGAASAVLNSMIRNLHRNTTTRIVLIDPPLSSHKVKYRLEQGSHTTIKAYAAAYGLTTALEEILEVAS